MSRIGKKPIPVPAGVNVTLGEAQIEISGPKGELSMGLSEVVTVSLDEGTLHVHRPDDSRRSKSHQGLIRSLLANMVEGVSQGFTRVLEINGVGYRAETRGARYIRFDLGYSHPILFELPAEVDAQVQPTVLTLTSANKERLGQVAAQIRSLRPPEPYKGKGIKYQEEHIVRKAGKAGK